jgi:hypothetical protein
MAESIPFVKMSFGKFQYLILLVAWKSKDKLTNATLPSTNGLGPANAGTAKALPFTPPLPVGIKLHRLVMSQGISWKCLQCAKGRYLFQHRRHPTERISNEQILICYIPLSDSQFGHPPKNMQ